VPFLIKRSECCSFCSSLSSFVVVDVVALALWHRRKIMSAQPTSAEVRFHPNVSTRWVDLICRLLEKDPTKRISVDEALLHPALAVPAAVASIGSPGSANAKMIDSPGAGIGSKSYGQSPGGRPMCAQVSASSPGLGLGQTIFSALPPSAASAAAMAAQSPVGLAAAESPEAPAAAAASASVARVSSNSSGGSGGSADLLPGPEFKSNVKVMQFQKELKASLREKIVASMLKKDEVRDLVRRHHADGLLPDTDVTVEHFRRVRSEFLKIAGRHHVKVRRTTIAAKIEHCAAAAAASLPMYLLCNMHACVPAMLLFHHHPHHHVSSQTIQKQ
jgi:hypothetical protein